MSPVEAVPERSLYGCTLAEGRKVWSLMERGQPGPQSLHRVAPPYCVSGTPSNAQETQCVGVLSPEKQNQQEIDTGPGKGEIGRER